VIDQLMSPNINNYTIVTIL